MVNNLRLLINKYQVFLKYFISAGIAFALDLTLFNIFNRLLSSLINDKSIIIATIMARVISSFINYLTNRNKVFGKEKNKLTDKKTLIYYYLLVVIQLCVSALSVFVIHKFIKIEPTIIKVPVDVVIFIVNFFVQKNIIFKE